MKMVGRMVGAREKEATSSGNMNTMYSSYLTASFTGVAGLLRRAFGERRDSIMERGMTCGTEPSERASAETVAERARQPAHAVARAAVPGRARRQGVLPGAHAAVVRRWPPYWGLQSDARARQIQLDDLILPSAISE